MPRYPYVALNTIIEFKDNQIHGLNIETRATNPSKIARVQAISLAKEIYEDPMILVTHPKFSAFPFDNLKVIKTSVKIPSGMIEETPYKPFFMTSSSAKRDSDSKSGEHLSPGSWLLEEAEMHGLLAEEDDKNTIRFGIIIGAVCSQHPAMKSRAAVCLFIQLEDRKMIEYMQGKLSIKLPMIADVEAIKAFEPIIEKMTKAKNTAIDYVNLYYLVLKTSEGMFVKEYPKGDRCLGRGEIRERSVEMLRPFIKNLLPTSDGLYVDRDCNFEKVCSDDDVNR